MQRTRRGARWALTTSALATVALLPGVASGKWYDHSSGVSFQYPAGWRPVVRGKMLQLIPPGLAAGQVQTEVYLIGADSVAGQGIRGIDDPRVAPYLAQQLASVSPSMRRVGPARYFAMRKGGGTLGGRGVELRFKGTSARGQPILASAFACIIGGNGVVLLAAAPPAKFPGRAATMRRLFVSLGYRKGAGGGLAGSTGALARQFVGTWTTMSKNTQTTYALYANGTYRTWYSSSYSGRFSNRYGHQTGHWGTAGQRQGQGRWSVTGNRRQGTLILQTSRGRSVVHYRVHVSKGRTYWREYYFGRTLYMRSR